MRHAMSEQDMDNNAPKSLNKKQRRIVAALLLMTLLLIPAFVSADKAADPVEEDQGGVSFSLPSGFYDEPLNIRLEAFGRGEILYTLDGSVPGRDNPAAFSYDPGDGICLPCGPEEQINTVKAALAEESGGMSEVETSVYVVGDNAKGRYQIPALFVSGDPADLLDSDTGIFAWDNRMLRGREYEKEVQATLLDVQGHTVFSQNCGLRLHGQTSRMKNQPSFRLYARREYDEQNRFRCLLFEDYSTEHSYVTGVKSVIVRNAGNDHGYAHLRTELATRICAQAGFMESAASSPVCVYINGEYYGVYWFVENYDDSYFEKKYGEYDGVMEVMEGVVAYLEPQEDDDEITRRLKEEYNRCHEQTAYSDLNDDAAWQALNDFIDVENFLYYMAIQNYLGNADVLVNNFKTYRYYSPSGEYQEGSVFDGRYRFLLYDLDQTLGWGPLEKTSAESNILNTANRLGYDIFYNALFANIMKRPEGREFYIRCYLSLLNYYFGENAKTILQEMHASHEAELRYQYSVPGMMDSNYETPETIDYDHVLEELEEIEFFLEDRPGWALVDLEEAFGIKDRYTLELTNEGEADISVDLAVFHDKRYSGTYFAETPVTITAHARCGSRFDHWLVDGTEYYDETLVITGDLLRGDAISVECVVSPDPDMGLWISAVKSRGGSDYIELTNFGRTTEDLAEYTLADGAAERNVSTLPSLLVEPGQSVTVYCKNYTGAEAIGQAAVNFNIKAGETVYLYRKGLLQQVKIPRLGLRDGVYRLDVYSGEFYEKTE